MNQKPPELRTAKNSPKTGKLPAALIESFDAADWLIDPASWDRKEFVKETHSYMKALGYGAKYDRHLVSLLAVQIELAIRAIISIEETGIEAEFNKGATKGTNPAVKTLKEASGEIRALMNALGISPQGRKVGPQPEEEDQVASFLKGPQ